MLDGHIRILLVVQQGAAAIVGVRGDQDVGARIDDAVTRIPD